MWPDKISYLQVNRSKSEVISKGGVAWLGLFLMSCIPEPWEDSVGTLRGVWVWSCREKMVDRNSEGDREREENGECEGDWDKKGEGVEPVNIVRIDEKESSRA